MFAKLEIVKLSNDVVTESPVGCPCKDPEAMTIPECPADE